MLNVCHNIGEAELVEGAVECALEGLQVNYGEKDGGEGGVGD